MKHIKLTLSFLILTLINGCMPRYNLVPDYDDKNKVLTIESIHIEPVVFYEEKTEYPENEVPDAGSPPDANSSTIQIMTNDKQCSRIIILEQRISGTHWYFPHSMKDSINNKYEQTGGSCTIESVANLNFLECKKINLFENIEALYKFNYFITSSTENKSGYDMKVGIINISQGCFNFIKNHFISITDPKYITK